MAIRTQKWTPDTHDAVLTCEWDDEALDEHMTCISALLNGEEQADPQAVYDLIFAENRLKNEAIGAICAALPDSMRKVVLDGDGDPTGELAVKSKHWPTWDFGAIDGKIALSVPGASPEVLANIATLLAARFGDAVTLIEG
jgi:hypothetical protein